MLEILIFLLKLKICEEVVKIKFVEYLRKIEGYSEERIDKVMTNFERFGEHERYVNYCLENGIEREPIKNIIYADSW